MDKLIFFLLSFYSCFPTVSFAIHKQQSRERAEYGNFVEKRITDRRLGDRRRALGWKYYNVFSSEFWIDVMFNQGISLVLIAILAIILLIHLLIHP